MITLEGERGLAVAGAGGAADQPFDVGGDDPRDALVDLRAGLVVAAAEPVFDALQLLLGLREGTLAGGGRFAVLF